MEAEAALLLRMIRLCSFELKTYLLRPQFTDMLRRSLAQCDVITEARELLLSLGGEEFFDTVKNSADDRGTLGDYTVLHYCTAYARNRDGLGMVLEKGPDLHQLGLDRSHTPQNESPTSLAMYSCWAFADELHQLATIEVEIMEFLDQELKRKK